MDFTRISLGWFDFGLQQSAVDSQQRTRHEIFVNTLTMFFVVHFLLPLHCLGVRPVRACLCCTSEKATENFLDLLAHIAHPYGKYLSNFAYQARTSRS